MHSLALLEYERKMFGVWLSDMYLHSTTENVTMYETPHRTHRHYN